MDMRQVQHAAHGIRCVLHNKPPTQAGHLAPAAQKDVYKRQGQNLPDKEFRYLRTVIVTAAVHWGFNSMLAHLLLTFQHRAGVSLSLIHI